MEDRSLNDPGTPPLRATSEGPSLPHRNSVEDADSTLTRKRPRLDSGVRLYRSTSAEPSSAVPFNPTSHYSFTTSDPQSPDPNTFPQRKATITPASSPTTIGTSSKMAVHTRDSSASEAVAAMKEIEVQDTQPGRSHDHDAEPTAGLDEAQEEPLLITQEPQLSSPSPLGSPEIEVAELEDMNGHVGPTVWHKAGAPIPSLEQQHQQLILSFPGLRNVPNPLAHCQRLREMFYRDDLGEGEYLVAVANWVRRWLVLADRNPAVLFDLYTTETEFWSELCNVFESLLSRK